MATLELTKQTLEAIKRGKLQFEGKIFGGHGLFAQVSSKGSISFAVKFRRDGQERREGLGKWPAITIEEARRLALSIDRVADPSAKVRTFEEAADEWLRVHRGALAPRTVVQIERYLNAGKAGFGKKDIKSVRPSDVLSVLRTFESRGAHESARRVRVYLHQVFNWAADPDRPAINPASADLLKSRLAKAPKPTHHAAMPAAMIPGFMRELIGERAQVGYKRTVEGVENNDLHPSIRGALALLVLTAMRTNEVLNLRWSDIEPDWQSLEIPAERMKSRVPHRIFLSDQARGILEAIKPFSGNSAVVFPGRDGKSPLSQMALLMCMRRRTEGAYVPHGFRSSFSSWSNSKKGGNANALSVERALAHAIGGVMGVYNAHKFDEEARVLWEKWADFCIPRKV